MFKIYDSVLSIAVVMRNGISKPSSNPGLGDFYHFTIASYPATLVRGFKFRVFPSPRLVALTKASEHSLPYYLPHALTSIIIEYQLPLSKRNQHSVQILDKAVYVSLSTITLGEGMNP